MSKQGYLLTILFICIIGFVVATQLRVATVSSDQLLADEILRKIEIQVKKVTHQLRRFPDSDAEFETLVLGQLDWHRYKRRIFIDKFIPGTRVTPAFFQVRITGDTAFAPVNMVIAYYGCHYRANLHLKGKLAKQ